MSFAGSVFMSEAHRPFSSILDTAEHLLHEHSHYRFALMLEHDEFVVEEGRSYYSVWRRQDRDLNGMLQAIFVFARIAHFLRLGIEQGIEGAWSQRRGEVIRDLKAGVRDLTIAAPPRFTPIGRRLFDHIHEEVAR
jgi:HEXXH motif-containing protein